MEPIYQINNEQRDQAGLYQQQTIEFKTKNATREKEKHFLIVKVLFHQEDITIINIYRPNKRPSKYIWQYLIELQREETIQQQQLTMSVSHFL